MDAEELYYQLVEIATGLVGEVSEEADEALGAAAAALAGSL